ncbi:hypothetical protein BJD49_gp082 [Acinetobacter phage vB_AbaM_phiAbaA1]|uniref:hypothetical protein n=1 Tax=Acinetobacter phage vB_AbaM_phiAbaA1 TaxID=1605379 RepID=UPI00078C9602|nr:hypothetical protein BJD49_gp082 [Acinetobacter phage vB_AbaM_phiAbaA1]AJK27208.1 hypothetical protein phiAbaA1_105 [Acinetobacter phage vB_AbaM_phiAbaA1]
MFKDKFLIWILVVVFIILLVSNMYEAKAATLLAKKPSVAVTPPLVIPQHLDMIKKECKYRIKTGKKVPKHCYKFV